MPRPGSAWDRPPQERAPEIDPGPVGLGDPWTRPKIAFPVEIRTRLRGPGGRKPSRIDGLLIAALILSLSMHGLVLGVIALASWLESLRKPEEPPPVMEIVDIAEFPALSEQVRSLADVPDAVEEPASPDGQIVQLAKPETPEVAPDDARFRAEFERRAEEETAARETALTPGVLADEFRGLGTEAGQGTERFEGDTSKELAMLGSRRGESGDAGEEPRADRSIDEVLKKDEFGILAKPEPRRYAGAPGRRGGSIDEAGTGGELAMAGAPNNDYLPGVRPGERTALNAKRDFFASFWNRVSNQVEPYWVKHIRRAKPRPGELQRRDYRTRANIVLGPDGSFVAVELVQSCGYPPWDEAVLAAFQDAAPFLNPPRGMVEADGKIHMDDWTFVVGLTGGKIVHMYGDPRSGKLFPGVNEGAIGPR